MSIVYWFSFQWSAHLLLPERLSEGNGQGPEGPGRTDRQPARVA